MKKKIVKKPKDMTTDEAIAHVFHPEALRQLKKHKEKIAKDRKVKKVSK